MIIKECYPEINGFAETYFDYSKFARDLFISDYYFENGFVFTLKNIDMEFGIRTLTDDEFLLEKERIESIYNDRINYATKTRNIRLLILSSIKISTENIFTTT